MSEFSPATIYKAIGKNKYNITDSKYTESKQVDPQNKKNVIHHIEYSMTVSGVVEPITGRAADPTKRRA